MSDSWHGWANGRPVSLHIERDDDCDCAWWWRWRITLTTVPDRPGTDEVVAHAITRWGARRKLQRLIDGQAPLPGDTLV